jgi:limonene 1,2-monooxygenase
MQPQRMKFGVFIAPFHRVGENPLLAMDRDLELIQWLDTLGYDEAWIGEHHSAGWEIISDPALVIAAAAERTKRIKLGSGVVSLPYHQPLILADRYVQLDYMSHGRAMLGVGPGALVSDAVMMGIDPVTQRPRMDEALGVILRLLRGEVVDYTADWFELHSAQLQLLPYSDPCFPIAVASTTSPSGMVTAGKYGVGVLSLGAGLVGGKKNLAEHWAMAEEAAARAGTTMDRRDWRLVIRIHLAESREQAMQDVAAGRIYERDNYFRATGGLRSDTTLEQEIAEDTAIVGTPEDAIAALRRLQETTGGFGGFMALAHEWAGREKTLQSYELFARYVVPQFQGLLGSVERSYQYVVDNRRGYGGPALAAIHRAYTDAGREIPPELTPRNLR